MSAFQMTCWCGHQIKVDAEDRQEAVSKIQGIMNENAIAAHMKEKHLGEPVPPLADIHRTIDSQTVAA